MDKPLVLLVDDNEATTTLMTALLQKEFALEVAADGTEAVELLRTKAYGAIVLDLLMPQMDGYGVLDFLRADKPAMLKRVLVVSAALNRNELAKLRNFDVFAIVSKPFEVDHLLAAVRKCTGTAPGPHTMINPGLILLVAEILRHRWI